MRVITYDSVTTVSSLLILALHRIWVATMNLKDIFLENRLNRNKNQRCHLAST